MFVTAHAKDHRCFCGKPATRQVMEVVQDDDPRLQGVIAFAQLETKAWICEDHFGQITELHA